LAGFGCMVPIPGRVPGQRDSLVLAKAANNAAKKLALVILDAKQEKKRMPGIRSIIRKRLNILLTSKVLLLVQISL